MIMSGKGKNYDQDARQAEDLSSRASSFAGHYQVPARRSKEESWELLQAKIAGEATRAGRSRSRSLRVTLGVAASLLLLMTAGAWLLFSSVTVTVPHGEQVHITLPDGSAVTLNAGTRLRRHRFFLVRRVRLAGEGYFHVTRGAGFRVVTPTGTVAVKGTRFNVLSRQDILDVACYSGEVAVTPTAKKELISLKKGEGIKIVAGEEKKYTLATEQERPSWEKGLFRFRNAPLQEVLDELGAKLLALIDLYGSILAAAKRLDLPYSSAWEYISRIERALGLRILEVRRGGRGGGRCGGGLCDSVP